MAKVKSISKKGKEYNYERLVVNGINKDVFKDLYNIAKNLGNLTVSALLKPELRKIRDSYPQDMRQDPNAL